MTQIGTVKWFDSAKGYGFIQSLGQGGDVFVHASQLLSGPALSPGDIVEFELGPSREGRLQATGVRIQHREDCSPAEKFELDIALRDEIRTAAKQSPPGGMRLPRAVAGRPYFGRYEEDTHTREVPRFDFGFDWDVSSLIAGAIAGFIASFFTESWWFIFWTVLIVAVLTKLTLLGLSFFTRTETFTTPITATCLRCGGEGFITADTGYRRGFQCRNCGHFWKARRHP